MRFFSALLLPLCLLASPAWAQAPCDPGLQGVSDPALAYRERDARRCEGFYVSPVSSTGSLRLVGLSRGALRFSKRDDAVTLSLPDVGQALRLRARALPEKTYYRLDAAPPPGPAWRWPLEVPQSGELRAQDLGIYAYLGNGQEEIHVPVIFDPKAGLSAVFQASQDLARLTWRWALSQDGRCAAMGDWQPPLEQGFDAAQRIELSLPADAGGEFCLEVAGQPKTGGDWLQGSWRVRGGS